MTTVVMDRGLRPTDEASHQPRVLVVSEDPFFIEAVRTLVVTEGGRVVACLGPAASPCILDQKDVCPLAAGSAIAIVDAPPEGVFRYHWKEISAGHYAERLQAAHPQTYVLLSATDAGVNGPTGEVAVTVGRVETLHLLQWVLRSIAIERSSNGSSRGGGLNRLAERLGDDALTDELTGLKNLRYFRARLEEEHAASLREGNPLALLLVDLDFFKRVNDRHGHPEGDRLLKCVAGAIASVVRQGETAARVGGEEFALLLPGATGQEALAAADRVRAAVAAVRLHPSHGGLVTITVSVGCASTGELGELGIGQLYGAADGALYEAKRQGRDRTVSARSPRALARLDSGA